MSSKIKVDDEVQWMEVKRHRSGAMSFSTKYGKVEAVNQGMATVKRRGGRKDSIAVRRLVPRNQPSPVNHVFGALTATTQS